MKAAATASSLLTAALLLAADPSLAQGPPAPPLPPAPPPAPEVAPSQARPDLIVTKVEIPCFGPSEREPRGRIVVQVRNAGKAPSRDCTLSAFLWPAPGTERTFELGPIVPSQLGEAQTDPIAFAKLWGQWLVVVVDGNGRNAESSELNNVFGFRLPTEMPVCTPDQVAAGWAIVVRNPAAE
jgi:hypothetical protein